MGFGIGIQSLNDGFNIGQQLSITLTDSNGVAYDLGRVTSFSSEPLNTEIDSKPINRGGFVDYKDARTGWQGEIMIDRTNGNMDALEALQERLWHTGAKQRYFTINVVINNDDVSVNEHSYERSAVKMTQNGPWKLDEKVEITLRFRAAERVVIS